jgi:hypothetical protein
MLFMLLSSCTTPNNAGRSTTVDASDTLPIWALGQTDASTKVVFIWSYKCAECRKNFEKLFSVFSRARDQKDILFVFIQYEPQDTIRSSGFVDAICSGHEFYNLHVFSYLLLGYSTEQTADLPIGKSTSKLTCQDDEYETGVITASSVALENRFGSSIKHLPILMLNGQVIKSPEALIRKIGSTSTP